MRRFARLALVALLAATGCTAPRSSPSATQAVQTPSPSPSAVDTPLPSVSQSPTPSPTPEEVATLIAAGDIGSCDVDSDSRVAAIVEQLEGTVAVLGDAAYPSATDATLRDCYGPTWGRFLERTRPAVGNHDLELDGGAAFWHYFGERAGTPGEGWYSYDLGAWHVVALNSNCELIACGPGSAQLGWLTADLADSGARCTVAYMHHPRFSSGPHGDYAPVAPLWEALDAAGVELVLAGHDHLYERFAQQDVDGTATPEGLRQITVGTGGYVLYTAERVAPNSELIIDDRWGVLVLALRTDSYDWSFVGVDGEELDAGSADCA